jgi:hypothetical protein
MCYDDMFAQSELFTLVNTQGVRKLNIKQISKRRQDVGVSSYRIIVTEPTGNIMGIVQR